MTRVLTLAAALMVLVAGFAVVAPSQAEAGLFNRDKCCKPAKKSRTPRRSKNECCEPAPTCCEAPAPTCCEAAPAPCYVEATPACGGCASAPACGGCDAAPACGGCEAQTACCPSRREKRKASKNCCVQTCGYENQGCSSCSAPVSACNSCGGGQIVQGCNSCGGQVIQGAVVEGCSDCGGAAVEAPTPAPEAAPEAPAAPAAPEGDSTT